MIREVRVIPRAKLNRVEELADNRLRVRLSAPAQDNKANKALIEVLAGYYRVKKAQVSIVRGEKSRDKIVEIV